MTNWVRERSLPVRVLMYAATAISVFALAAGMGAMAALMSQGGVGLLERGGPPPADKQDVDRAQQRDGAADSAAADSAAVEQKKGASQQAEHAAKQEKQDSVSRQAELASQREEAEYVGTVGDIQTKAVETFLKSHDKLLQYDALTDDDVQEMKANETALQDMAAQADNLAPPRKYEEQHKVFDTAIDELREAARLAHSMAADPVASAELGFDEYDGHVKDASALLQRSNKLLAEDYEAIEDVREISPEL